MRVRIMLDDEHELLSLYRWLADDHAVRRFGELRREAEPDAQGAQGALEIVSLVLGSGLSAAHLLTAIASWRATRPKQFLVRVQVGDRQVEVRTDDPRTVQSLAEQIEAEIVSKPEAS